MEHRTKYIKNMFIVYMVCGILFVLLVFVMNGYSVNVLNSAIYKSSIVENQRCSVSVQDLSNTIQTLTDTNNELSQQIAAFTSSQGVQSTLEQCIIRLQVAGLNATF